MDSDMASIGINPTFDDVHKVTIEVNFCQIFDKDIYHLPVRVKWLKYLRPELKFDGIDALIAQLNKTNKIQEIILKQREVDSRCGIQNYDEINEGRDCLIYKQNRNLYCRPRFELSRN